MRPHFPPGALEYVFGRRDGLAPSRNPANPDWTYRTFNQLNGDYRADPGMAITPQGNSAMPNVPDYQLNQLVPTQGVMPVSSAPSINPITGLPQFNLPDAQRESQMSGTMMPPGMPMDGAPGGISQLPPEVLQMLMQKMGGAGGQPPGGPPMGQPPPQMQGPMGPSNMPNPGQQGGMHAAPPIPQPGAAQQLAQQGRFGDSIVAHVTPGEISIPPQIQTPQLIEMLRHAFAQAGVRLEQFTAGSPQASRNPETGAPELSLWASLLPILGAVGGAALAPVTGGLSVPAGAAIGGGLGGAAGGAIDHQSGLGIGLSALGGAAGGYFGAPAGAAAESAAPALASTVSDAAIAGGAGSGASSALAAPAAAMAPNAFAAPAANQSMLGQAGGWIKGNMPLIKTGIAAGTGAGLGGALAPPPSSDPLKDAGFKKPLPPLNPNFNALRGAGTVSTPQFGGYNPYAAVSGPNPGFSFFPQQ